MCELKMMFLHCFGVMTILLAAVEQVSIQVAKFADKHGYRLTALVIQTYYIE